MYMDKLLILKIKIVSQFMAGYFYFQKGRKFFIRNRKISKKEEVWNRDAIYLLFKHYVFVKNAGTTFRIISIGGDTQFFLKL